MKQRRMANVARDGLGVCSSLGLHDTVHTWVVLIGHMYASVSSMVDACEHPDAGADKRLDGRLAVTKL